MIVSQTFFRFTALSALGLSVLLAACGRHGTIPSQSEQAQIQSLVAAAPSNGPFGPSAFHHGFGRLLYGVELTEQQRTQLAQVVRQFRQAHPRGSSFDPQAFRALRDQVMATLTPQQLAQLQQNVQQWGGRTGAFGHWHHGPMWDLNLTDAQRAQIRQLVGAFRQSHPRGSAFDPQARLQLHQQILRLLTPQQRTQFEQRFSQLRQSQSPAPTQPL